MFTRVTEEPQPASVAPDADTEATASAVLAPAPGSSPLAAAPGSSPLAPAPGSSPLAPAPGSSPLAPTVAPNPGATSLAPLGEPPLALLAPFEQRAFRFIDWLLRRHLRATEIYNHSIGQGYVSLGSGRMLRTVGLERLAGVRPDDGILLVSNHRSFFDLYELATTLYRHSPLQQPFICPVRGNFFYERYTGILVNLLAGGGHMYPPFFRDPARADWNRWALSRTAEMLRAGNVMIGFHPEGTRNKNADPYTPLPAQPGVGKLVMESWPVVVPAFIHGMSSSFVGDVVNNFVGKRVAFAVFGEPIDLGAWKNAGNRLATHKRIADHLLKTIYALGEEERALRAQLPA